MPKRGFTLLEILLVVAAIAILAGIVIVAINPGRQLAAARNAARVADVNAILNAVYQYSLDHSGAFPTGISSTTLQMLGTNSTACDVGCGGGSSSNFDMSGNVLLMHFDEANGATSFKDSSGSGGSGSCSGAACPTAGTSGKFGSALSFDGTGDYLNFGNPSTLNFGTGALSIELWYKPNVGNQATILAAKGTSSESGYFLILDNRYNGNANTVGFSVNSMSDNGKYVERAPTTATYNVGQWNHVVGVWDKSSHRLRIYMNGAEVNTSVVQNSGTEAQIGNTNIGKSFLIGAYNIGASPFFNGSIDEVAVFNRALTPEEILQHYQSSLPLGSASGGSGSGEATASACLDLSPQLVSDYLAALPADPRLGSAGNTYYAIKKSAGGRIFIQACGAENDETITVTR